ncbi:MAG: ribulose-phosphate 3-epimerase [Firmicutes bacterium]|nr:ribulose-phosphate 3-epimerase [Bacillota bacterium]
MKISVSYLSSIFDKKSTINLIDNSNADYIHVDLMDGKFVPKNNFNVREVINDLKDTNKPLDIHLMTFEPEKYVDELSTLNPARITFHLESNTNIEKTIKLIKSKGIEVGIAIKPNTDIMYLDNYLNDIDIILVMSVEPGAGGQRFMFDMIDKIEDLNDLRYNKNYLYKISVDGGINEYTALKCHKAGADIVVSGSYVCHHENFNAQINNLKRITK